MLTLQYFNSRLENLTTESIAIESHAGKEQPEHYLLID